MRIDSQSLAKTVDSVHESAFFALKTTAVERLDFARAITARQAAPGAYADTFAGFPSEREHGIQVFTGERITSASARHILGEEACRALLTLGVRDLEVRGALSRATAGLMKCLARSEADGQRVGRYCCGKCSVGMWRHLLAGGLDRQEERLADAARFLRDSRDGEGGWNRFPFWYTVLALTEMVETAAGNELAYAAARLKRAAKTMPRDDRFAKRRHALAERALSRI